MKFFPLFAVLITRSFGYIVVPPTDILCDDRKIVENPSFIEMNEFVGHPWLNVLSNFMVSSVDYELPEYLKECQLKMNESIRIQNDVRKNLRHCFKDIKTMKKLFLNENFAQIFRYLCSFDVAERAGELCYNPHNYYTIITSHFVDFNLQPDYCFIKGLNSLAECWSNDEKVLKDVNFLKLDFCE
jgi:hypothetical protein